jgi:hypothetical protein
VSLTAQRQAIELLRSTAEEEYELCREMGQQIMLHEEVTMPKRPRRGKQLAQVPQQMQHETHTVSTEEALMESGGPS